MFGRKPKIPNPRIKEFEKSLKQRGLLLVEAGLYGLSFIIPNEDDFINFAKRSKVYTVFRSSWSVHTNYFYIVDGIIIRIYLKNKVRRQ